MSFDSVERSNQGATPVELYDFVAPAKTWRLTSHEADVLYNSNIYSAVTGARSTISVLDLATNQSDVAVQVPALHEIAQTYLAGVPMRELQVTITRFHIAAGVGLQFWQGYASDISVQKGQASFRIPSGTNDALATDVPAVCAQKLCNHVLYDAYCTVARAGFVLNTSIASISADGNTVGLAAPTPAGMSSVISGVNVVTPWALHGEVVHTASGERRTVINQASTTNLTLQAQFPNNAVHVGDAIQVFGGCDHSILVCDVKFANGPNHGGHPYMLPSNIFYTGLLTSRYR